MRRSSSRSPRTSSADVVIVGAGAAGLSAARTLTRNGFSIQVLEARDRLGGRIHTTHDASHSTPIELGAEFVHGSAEETVRLIREAGLTLCDIDGEHWVSSRGRLMIQVDDFWMRLERVMRLLGRIEGADKSFAEFLDGRPGGRALARERALARQWVRGFHAADPAIASARALAEGGSPGGDEDEQRQARVLEGQSAIVEHLASTVLDDIRLSEVVTRIEWELGGVSITTRNARTSRSRTIEARSAIITVPLGVLSAQPGSDGWIEFSPDLASRKSKPLSGLATGAVVRMTVVLREPFWLTDPPRAVRGENTRQLAFVHSADGSQPVCWTPYPLEAPALVAWYGGPDAAALSRESRATIESRTIASLARTFHISPRRLESLVESCHMHDWNRDPYSRGAYSYVAVGGMNASKELARPVEGTLFFAGEATDVGGRNGTVEGAIGSGDRAARQARAALEARARRGRKGARR